MMATAANLISIVDDDPSIRDATRGLLRSEGYQVATFPSAELFLRSGALEDTACLILDVGLPGMDGLELQRRLRSAQASVPVVFVTAHDDGANRRQALEGGAVEFLCKPFGADALVEAVRTTLERSPLPEKESPNEHQGELA